MYYKGYSNDDYWYWSQKSGAWIFAGKWARDRGDMHQDAVRVSKLEMILINGIRSVQNKKV